jgi:hypothetical protein
MNNKPLVSPIDTQQHTGNRRDYVPQYFPPPPVDPSAGIGGSRKNAMSGSKGLAGIIIFRSLALGVLTYMLVRLIQWMDVSKEQNNNHAVVFAAVSY